MPDESTNPVGTAQIPQDDQAVKNQNGSDFVLDFGEGENNTEAVNSVVETGNLGTEQVENQETSNLPDVDFDSGDLFSEEKNDEKENISENDVEIQAEQIADKNVDNDFDISLDDSKSGEEKVENSIVETPDIPQETEEKSDVENDNEESLEMGDMSLDLEDNLPEDSSLGENLSDSENNVDVSENILDNQSELEDTSDNTEEVEDDKDENQGDIYDELDSYGELDFDDELKLPSEDVDNGKDEDIQHEENLENIGETDNSDQDKTEDLSGTESTSESIIDNIEEKNDKTEDNPENEIDGMVEDNGQSFEVNESEINSESLDDVQKFGIDDNTFNNNASEEKSMEDNLGDADNLQENLDKNSGLIDGMDELNMDENDGISERDNSNLDVEDNSDSVDGELKMDNDTDNISGEVEDSQTLEDFGSESGLLDENQSDSLDVNDNSLEENLLDKESEGELISGEYNGNRAENEEYPNIDADNVVAEDKESSLEGNFSADVGVIDGDVNTEYEKPEDQNIKSSDEDDIGMSFDLQMDSFDDKKADEVINQQSEELKDNSMESLQDFSENSEVKNKEENNVEEKVEISLLGNENTESIGNVGDEKNVENDQSDSVEMKSTLSLDEILDSELQSGRFSTDTQNVSSESTSSKSSDDGKSKRMLAVFAGLGLFLMVGVVAYLAFPNLLSNIGGGLEGTIEEEHSVASENDNQFPEVSSSEGENILDTGKVGESGNNDITTDENISGVIDNGTKVEAEFPDPMGSDDEDGDSTREENNSSNEDSREEYISSDVGMIDIVEEDQVTVDDINNTILSFKMQGESYYSIAQENSDRHIYKYAVKILSLCDDYEQRISNGEGIDNESYEAFKSEINNLLAKINEYNGKSEIKEINAGDNSVDNSYFEGKEEYLDYIYDRENSF